MSGSENQSVLYSELKTISELKNAIEKQNKKIDYLISRERHRQTCFLASLPDIPM